jgi:hypothetical protein
MDNQNNSNNQNPINPLDSTQAVQDTKPAEEIVNINTQSTQDLPLPEEKTQENESQNNMETQGFPQMDSSTPPPPPIPTVEEIPNEEQGTNSPNLDIPTVISTDNKVKNKFGGKTIATILGIFILVGAIGAGVTLLKQQQDVREKAKVFECASNDECGIGEKCKNNLCVSAVTNPAPQQPQQPTPVSSTLPNGVTAPLTPGGCTKGVGDFTAISEGKTVTVNCSDAVKGERDSYGTIQNCIPGYYKCTIDPTGTYTVACCKVGTGGTTPTTPPSNPVTPSNPPSTVTASCLNIKAYDENWATLSVDGLKSLKTGDKVRFTVAGTATSGTFSKALFTINTVIQPETTSKKPGTEEFYTEYTIPSGTTSFTINAQIYHSTKGWI